MGDFNRNTATPSYLIVPLVYSLLALVIKCRKGRLFHCLAINPHTLVRFRFIMRITRAVNNVEPPWLNCFKIILPLTQCRTNANKYSRRTNITCDCRVSPRPL